MKRRRIAIAYPRFRSGGSEAGALWGLQALRQDYEVSLLTYGPVDLSRLNEYYGTTLQRGDFGLRRAFLPQALEDSKLCVLQRRLFQRYCKRVAPQFDFENESFGIAVAELVKAGCITFVRNDGGQVEIVDHDALTYSSAEEATKKILAVLDNPELQHSLRRHLSDAGRRFSVEAFVSGLWDATAAFLSVHR